MSGDIGVNTKTNFQEEINYNDNKILDELKLTKEQYRIGIIKSIFFTAIAIIVFFVPITVNDSTDIVFGLIYNSIIKALGKYGIWLICFVIVINGVLSVIGKYFRKKGKLYEYYKGDSILHPIFYMAGSICALVYFLDSNFLWFTGPEWMIGPKTGATIMSIVISVAWIITVSAFFLPFLLNYGLIDFIGSLMEPLMRPIFKAPGRSAVNAIASFVSSSSVGVLITSKLYRSGVYTEKEADIIVTGFSAVSVGFAYMVIKTAGLSERFLSVYFLALFITLLVSIFMARIPPLSRKSSYYIDGRLQNPEDFEDECKFNGQMIKIGVDRAVKKSYMAKNLPRELVMSLTDGFNVLPKVISLLTAVGITALVIANYTPVFQWMGKLFEPILRLCMVPNAAEIAPSFPVGIAEMFLPVLLIADKVQTLDIGARYMVVTVSMTQIIFFSETIVVMMATKMPIKLKELIICFFERTIIAIPITAIFMHLLF